ncbi:uncharacterized protein LOC122521060 [Polistes fuscatus]|uniref:uncharacterized protein LOC122521060 n=1 Tax=Polistes fuscatus TaxID=30207 RepID=UPI001CA7C018|nr:uncharacterized protein LOC122521060 [Polistes fuscatus]
MSRIFSILFVIMTITLFVNATNKPPIVCDRPNEEYQCGSACQTRCTTLGEPCPIVNIVSVLLGHITIFCVIVIAFFISFQRCNDDCFCKENYARDGNDVCIPIPNCPPKQVETTPASCDAEQ